MVKPPHTGGEMRAFYPVFRRWELAARWRYTTPHQVAYPAPADNVSRPLPNCLRGMNQPAISLSADFYNLMQPCRPDGTHTYFAFRHAHGNRQRSTPHEGVATAGRDRAGRLSASTHGRSLRPPWLVYTA